MRFSTLAMLIAPLALGACVSAHATLLGPRQGRAPVHEDEVRVFLAEDEVPESCQRVAIINASGDVDMTNEAQMIRAAKRRAGKLGANAIQLLSTREPGTGRRIAAVILPGISTDRKGEMLAFHCTEQRQAGFFGAVKAFVGLGE
ncbi:MAG TPA: hypothetical protein VFS20_02100 [Longimicrobium sp.]|nr:hypothetical protein [Longimicrobium sp.]